MFCPKCGTKNPEDGKFCRSCGTDLGNVSAALTSPKGSFLADIGLDSCDTDGSSNKLKSADDVFADAVKSIISGIGFLVISIVLFYTNVAGGSAWWWAMLFPAFSFLAKGVSDLLKSKRMERTRTVTVAQPSLNAIRPHEDAGSLPPAHTQFVAPAESRYKTGDLVPPSVAEETTKHLELNQEGETMTLPKRP